MATRHQQVLQCKSERSSCISIQHRLRTRLAGYKNFLAAFRQDIASVFLHKDAFWIAQSVAAALLFATGVALFASYARDIPLWIALALALLPLIDLSAYSLVIFYDLGNETFAPIYIGLFLLTSRRIFASRGSDTPLTLFFVLGLLGGIGYATKLPYIALFLTGCCVSLYLYARNRNTSLLMRGLGVQFAAFLSVFAVICAVFGMDSLQFLRFHWNTLIHTGQYGSGELGVFNTNTVIENIISVGKQIYPLHFVVAVLAVLAALAFYHARHKITDSTTLPQLLTILTLAFFTFIGPIKHYQKYYMIPFLWVVPYIVYELVLIISRASPAATNTSLKTSFHIVVAIVCVSTVGPSLVDAAQRIQAANDRATRFASTQKDLDMLPMADDEMIFYAYGTNASWSSGMAMALVFSNGIPHDKRLEVFRDFFPDTRIQNLLTWNPQLHADKIRYIVVPLAYYPSEPKISGWQYPFGEIAITPDDTVTDMFSDGSIVGAKQNGPLRLITRKLSPPAPK